MVGRPRSRKSAFGIRTDIHESSFFPVKQYLLTYLIHICNSMDVSRDVIDLAFSVFSTDSQEELVEFLISGMNDSSQDPDTMVKDITYDYRNAGHRVKKIFDRNNRLNEHDLADMIFSLCVQEKEGTHPDTPPRLVPE